MDTVWSIVRRSSRNVRVSITPVKINVMKLKQWTIISKGFFLHIIQVFIIGPLRWIMKIKEYKLFCEYLVHLGHYVILNCSNKQFKMTSWMNHSQRSVYSMIFIIHHIFMTTIEYYELLWKNFWNNIVHCFGFITFYCRLLL